jgi:hypothetical protein
LRKAIEKGEFKTKIDRNSTCPKCRTHRKSDIKERKRTKPQHRHLKRFRCVNCGHEYEKPAFRRQKTNRLSKSDWDMFIAKYENKINQLVKNQRNEFHEYYISLKDIQILCKRCHFAFHKGMKLCSVCKERYHENQWDMCFICYTKTDKENNRNNGHTSKSQNSLNQSL